MSVSLMFVVSTPPSVCSLNLYARYSRGPNYFMQSTNVGEKLICCYASAGYISSCTTFTGRGSYLAHVWTSPVNNSLPNCARAGGHWV